MKYFLILFLSCPALAYNGPYFTGPLSNPANIQISAGGLFNSRIAPVSAFTNVAIAYHQADPSNSLVPLEYQAWLPPESWGFALGAGGANGDYNIGAGLHFNLANYVQAYAAEGLMLLGPIGERLGVAIAPNPNNALSVTAGPEWYVPAIQNGQVEKFNQLRILPGWYVGANYSKRF